MLLETASARTREWLIAHGDEPADAAAAQRFGELAARRLDGEPVAYLTGEREFFGRRFEVGPDVLIPRPETEALVVRALECAQRGARVLDLGTGSGAIGVTMAAERGDLRIVATDRSAAALAIARRNAERLAPGTLACGRLELRVGSWWKAIGSDERFDVVVSNPPYVAEGDPHLARGDLRYEPRGALASGTDGLDAIRRIVEGAPRHLHGAGWLVVEHGHEHGEALRSLLAHAGWRDVRTHADEAGLERLTLARPFL